MASFNAAVAFSVFNIAASVLRQIGRAGSYCDETVNNSFMSHCGLLKSDPGNFLEVMGSINFRTRDGQICVSQENPQNSFTTLTVREQFEEQPQCCNSKEKSHITQRRAGVADEAEEVFGNIRNKTLGGMTYWEVIPDRCSKGAGCPLVVEISGAGGHPWGMALSLCTVCKKQMKVVMIAPMLGADEDTNSGMVKSVVDWVHKYRERASNIDPERVYLASVSRGNEIAIQTAIYGAHIFKAVVMTGKFKIPGTFENKWSRHRDHFRGRPKLAKFILHIGDEDDVLTDNDFYTHFTGLATVMADAVVPPTIDFFLYRGAGHDITWTTWNEMHSTLWTGSDS